MRGSQLPPDAGSRTTPSPTDPTASLLPHPCRGEALPRPPAPWARRFRVADTSRTTRSADQPSGCIHDRPAVHGRAQSPSRLKPADPNGQPIDSGTWAPHSPLQGAWGCSPGLQPRADGWRPPPLGSTSVPRRRCHSPALAGRRVRHRLTPTTRGFTHRRSVQAGATPGMLRPTRVGARRCLARRRGNRSAPCTPVARRQPVTR
jgi:hypothetical protein